MPGSRRPCLPPPLLVGLLLPRPLAGFLAPPLLATYLAYLSGWLPAWLLITSIPSILFIKKRKKRCWVDWMGFGWGVDEVYMHEKKGGCTIRSTSIRVFRCLICNGLCVGMVWVWVFFYWFWGYSVCFLVTMVNNSSGSVRLHLVGSRTRPVLHCLADFWPNGWWWGGTRTEQSGRRFDSRPWNPSLSLTGKTSQVVEYILCSNT